MINKSFIKKTAGTVAAMVIGSIIIYQVKKHTKGIID